MAFFATKLGHVELAALVEGNQTEQSLKATLAHITQAKGYTLTAEPTTKEVSFLRIRGSPESAIHLMENQLKRNLSVLG